MKSLLLLIFGLTSFHLVAQEAFVHQAVKGNIIQNYTTIDHSSCNGNPNAILTVTPNWKGVYNDHAIGVWYRAGKWQIYNADKAMMPKKTHFNVLVHNGNNFSIKSDAKGNVIVKTKKASIKIDGSGNITLSGQKIVMNAKNSFAVKSMKVNLDATVEMAIKSKASTTIKSGAQLALNAAIIMLNKGGRPAARVGDSVAGNKIINGSPTILIGQ